VTTTLLFALALALGGCGRVAPGTAAIDRGYMPMSTGNGTSSDVPSSSSDNAATCRAQTTYTTDSHGNRTVVATGAGCPR